MKIIISLDYVLAVSFLFSRIRNIEWTTGFQRSEKKTRNEPFRYIQWTWTHKYVSQSARKEKRNGWNNREIMLMCCVLGLQYFRTWAGLFWFFFRFSDQIRLHIEFISFLCAVYSYFVFVKYLTVIRNVCFRWFLPFSSPQFLGKVLGYLAIVNTPVHTVHTAEIKSSGIGCRFLVYQLLWKQFYLYSMQPKVIPMGTNCQLKLSKWNLLFSFILNLHILHSNRLEMSFRTDAFKL